MRNKKIKVNYFKLICRDKQSNNIISFDIDLFFKIEKPFIAFFCSSESLIVIVDIKITSLNIILHCNIFIIYRQNNFLFLYFSYNNSSV